MRITLAEFRKRLKEPDLYRMLADRYQNTYFYIPKKVSSKLLLVRSLLINNIKPSKIHKNHGFSYSYISKVKLNLHKQLRAEKVFEKLVYDNRNHKQCYAIVAHLVKTCGGCSVYFKHRTHKMYDTIMELHLKLYTVDEIKAEFDAQILLQNPNNIGWNGLRPKVTCTKKYIQYVIRSYERVMNPMYLPKKYKTTNLYV